MRTHAQLDALYDGYFAGNPRRNRGMSIGRPLAHWLLDTWYARDVTVGLDFGSGFSSLLFRWLGGAITVDGDSGWLDVTRQEIASHGFDHSHLFRLAEFAADPMHGFGDLVLMDLGAVPFRKGVGGAETRLRYAGLACECVLPGGLLVLDDWHQPDYAARMTTQLMAHGFSVRALPETTDEFGRFAAVAERTPITQPDTGTRERGRFGWLRMETKDTREAA